MKYGFLLGLLGLIHSSIVFSVSPISGSLTMKGILGGQKGQLSQFKQVEQIRAFQFPADHLVHQAYKTEWWYFSGNLGSSSKNKSQLFSYQFTLFRFALAAEKASTDKSNWRSNNIYMAHIALTDINQQQFYQQERFSRDALKLAGAIQNTDGSLQFWLNDWQIKSLYAEQLFPLKLNINNQDFSINLQLDMFKPMVLQGKQGRSQKSSQFASYYYSYTRLKTKGSIKLNNKEFLVTGNSWFDREWSTSSLGDNQQGWDWFALHLDDGSDLMLYQMRNKNGSKDSYSKALLVDSQANSQTIEAKQFQLKAVEFWQSPVSAIKYPSRWILDIPEYDLSLTITPQMKAQEWSKAGGFSFNYWEGSVTVKGLKNQKKLLGTGYLEMTGYDNKD
ncbi:MAG: lipocalin-like domain-containing protein [Pseudomonadota bacterium]